MRPPGGRLEAAAHARAAAPLEWRRPAPGARRAARRRTAHQPTCRLNDDWRREADALPGAATAPGAAAAAAVAAAESAAAAAAAAATGQAPAPPKFEPFAPPSDARARMLAFRARTPLPDGGALAVAPLPRGWVPAAAALLADSFSDSMGYRPIYKNFLRRQIARYLEHHRALAPRAVVLVALRVPAEAEGAAVAAAGAGVDPGSSSISSSSAAPAAWVADDDDGGAFGDAMGTHPALPGSGSDDDAAAAAAVGAAVSAGFPFPAGGGGAGGGGAAAAAADEEELPPELAPGGGADLVGVVELSFSESTRSRALTLNPPPGAPYLCNMAVAEAWRRRGHGARLLAAAEAAAAAAAPGAELFLHARLQDAPAAALYRAAGYAEAARDSWLVRLLGQDQRFLMVKRLAGGGGAEGGEGL